MKNILAACALLITTLGFTNEASASLNPEITVGTSGLGLAISHPVGKHQDVRLDYDFVDGGGIHENTNTSNTLAAANGTNPVVAIIPFKDVYQVETINLLYDRHTTRSPLYFSGGLAYDLNRIDATSIPDQSSFMIAGTPYSGTTFGSIRVHVRWDTIVPYLGVGLNKEATATKHYGRVELGAYFQGSRKILVDTSGVVASNPAIFGPYVSAFTARVPGQTPVWAIYPVLRASIPVGR